MGQLAAASEGAAKIDKEQKLVSQFINSVICVACLLRMIPLLKYLPCFL